MKNEHYPGLLTEREAAEWLELSVRTLQKWRYNGKGGLKYVCISRRAVRYRMEDLIEFCQDRLQMCTAETITRIEDE